ncbi:LLM class flavin-dependent oxidoreductase [Streptomyces sp. NPDC001212]
MPRELHLSVALDADGPHPATHWADLVGLAEQGALDFVTLGDSLAPPADDSRGRLDAVAVLARVAPLTSRIGLVPTVTTTHTEPFHTSTALATLDFVSEGRAGWLVDVSTTESEALAVGRRPTAPADELWAEAAEAAEVAARLWDSWEDDAEIRDAATGRFIDRDRLHYIDFEGPHFSVRGPSIVPRPPQGRPPVAVVLDRHVADARWELAARHADIVLLDAERPATARRARTALLSRAAGTGRDPGELRVLVRVAVALHKGAPQPLPPTGTPRFTGTAPHLATLLADWHEAAGTDGFHLLTAFAPADLPAIAEGLVPTLRRHNLFRTAYTGRTLRDHLGLPRPASRYARRTETVR